MQLKWGVMSLFRFISNDDDVYSDRRFIYSLAQLKTNPYISWINLETTETNPNTATSARSCLSVMFVIE
jgi:hypothetical protein